MGEEEVASRWEDTVWYAETAFPDVNGPSKMAMAEKVHALGIKVVVTGNCRFFGVQRKTLIICRRRRR